MKKCPHITVTRKPIATDIIIPNDSCHPSEQKLGAVTFGQASFDVPHK